MINAALGKRGFRHAEQVAEPDGVTSSDADARPSGLDHLSNPRFPLMNRF